MDRAQEMAVFARVVTEGSFSAAAQALQISPSAVSKQIGRLEERLGSRLLNRTTRRLALTPEGKAYFAWCRRILAEIEAAEAAVLQMNGEPRGLLRINAATSIGRDTVTPLLSELLQRHPELRVELTLTDHVVDLVQEGADVAIRIAALADSSLIARRLRPVERLVVASPDYLARHGAPQRPADLAQHECLIFEGLTDWRFTTPTGAVTVRVVGRFETNDASAMRAAAVCHLGVARIASFYIEADLREGRLVPLLPDCRSAEDTAIYALYPAGKHLSPKVRAFIDLLVERIRPVDADGPFCTIWSAAMPRHGALTPPRSGAATTP